MPVIVVKAASVLLALLFGSFSLAFWSAPPDVDITRHTKSAYYGHVHYRAQTVPIIVEVEGAKKVDRKLTKKQPKETPVKISFKKGENYIQYKFEHGSKITDLDRQIMSQILKEVEKHQGGPKQAVMKGLRKLLQRK
jgi:hypothetical protein